jgi:hypothetical protein
MPKTVIFLFHDDDASLNAGSHVAERVRQVAGDQGVELEVFCFGPAQGALTDESTDEIRVEFRKQIDALAVAGVKVGACLNAATSAGTVDELISRGLNLHFARDAFVRYALEGATVISF